MAVYDSGLDDGCCAWNGDSKRWSVVVSPLEAVLFDFVEDTNFDRP